MPKYWALYLNQMNVLCQLKGGVIIFKEIIIKPSYSNFIIDKKLSKLIQECGYENIWDIYARTDERIIKFIKDKTNTQHNQERITYKGEKKEGWIPGYIEIEKVDASRLWFIDTYDGAESIHYVEIVDKNLNYCETKYK